MKKHIILAILCCCSIFVMGQTNTFTGAINNAWTVAGNWSLGQVPTVSDTVIMTDKTCVIPANSGDHYAARVEMRRSTFTISSNATLNLGGDLTPTKDGMYITGTSGELNVFGTLNINNTGRNGIYNFHDCNIYGTVNISGVGYVSIANIGSSANLYIAASAIVNITGNGMSSGYQGPNNNLGAKLVSRGEINIKNVSNYSTYVSDGYFDNYGTILVDGGTRFRTRNVVPEQVVNHECGVIRVKNSRILGSMINKGYIYQDNSLMNELDSFVNLGFIEDVQESFDPMDTALVNQGYLIQPWTDTLNVGQLASPIFHGNGTGLSVVGNQFYTDSTLSAVGGQFDSLAVTWAPNANAEGLSKFYFRVNTGDCQQVMSIMTTSPVQNNMAMANYCEFTNGKSTELEVSGNVCVDGVVNVSQAFQLTPQMSPPTDPAMGYLYLDGNTNKLRYWNGGTWVDIQ